MASGWNLWVWLVSVVVRRYIIDILIIMITIPISLFIFICFFSFLFMLFLCNVIIKNC